MPSRLPQRCHRKATPRRATAQPPSKPGASRGLLRWPSQLSPLRWKGRRVAPAAGEGGAHQARAGERARRPPPRRTTDPGPPESPSSATDVGGDPQSGADAEEGRLVRHRHARAAAGRRGAALPPPSSRERRGTLLPRSSGRGGNRGRTAAARRTPHARGGSDEGQRATSPFAKAETLKRSDCELRCVTPQHTTKRRAPALRRGREQTAPPRGARHGRDPSGQPAASHGPQDH